MKDVIIIGGGPAGASLAYRLAQKGIEVLLFEKNKVPRFKPCAGGITRKVIPELDFSLLPVVEEEIARFVFTSNLAAPVEETTVEPAVYTVHRAQFDAYLLKKAASAGALSSRPAEIRSALHRLIKRLGLEQGKILSPERGWVLPLNPFPKQLHNGAAPLLGDAAGLAGEFLELLAGQASYPQFYRRGVNLLLRKNLKRPQPTR